MEKYYEAPLIPSAFIWRRIHSLAGLWFTLYLIEHLFTNSQAALFMGDDGKGFIDTVNWIQSIPYLHVIELLLLGLPFAIHAIWGVQYLFTSKFNSYNTDGSQPNLSQYPLNHAYTWQRITAWILLVGVIAHVIHMRFIEYPTSIVKDSKKFYLTRLEPDERLYPLSKKFDFKLYDSEDLSSIEVQDELQRKEKLKPNQVLAVSPDFGTAELLIVRDTFKSPLMIVLYTGFVLAACFHGFNGLWTFMVKWGFTLTERSQRYMRKLAIVLMTLISLLGLAAIWGTYWITLNY